MLFYSHVFFAALISRMLGLSPFLFILGSLLPDVDNPNSNVGSLCKRLSYYLKENYSHRGLTHSLLFAVPCLLIPSFGLGVLSHILLDLLNKRGVRLLYPSKSCFVLLGGPLVTGKHDFIFSVSCLVVMLLF